MKHRVVNLLAPVGLLFLLSASSLGAGELTNRLRTAITQGLEVVNGSYPGESGKKEKIDKIREIVHPLFNFEEMARRSLGRHWRQRTPEEKKEFVGIFTEFLELNYAGKMDLYKGGDVVFLREVVDEDYARVDSKITDSKGIGYAVSYKLLRTDGDWKIYDLVVENISLVNNYRSQFNRIIRKTSYQELVKKMKEKSG